MMFAGGLPGLYTPEPYDLADVPGWMTVADIPDTVAGLFEELIVPSWKPVSVLDVAEQLPEPEVDPDDVRNLWPRPPDWHADAKCATLDPAASDVYFFGVDDEERPALPPAAVSKAREICYSCPALLSCLTWALEQQEAFGIWGGTTGRQRRTMRKALREERVTIARLLDIYG
jgi:WhiB family redox-sensing transcriptional regulator